MEPVKPTTESKLNNKPIGHVPSTSRPVHISGNVIGALPGASTARPAVRPVVVGPLALKKSVPTSKPAFTIIPPSTTKTAEATEKIPISDSSTEVKPLKGESVPAHAIRSAAGQIWQDPTLADWDPSDLGPEVTDHQLQQAFTTYGSLTRVRIVRDRKSGKSKGYGFVAFREPQDFLQALREMNGKYVGSRPIKLKKSNWTDRCADPSDTKKRRL